MIWAYPDHSITIRQHHRSTRNLKKSLWLSQVSLNLGPTRQITDLLMTELTSRLSSNRLRLNFERHAGSLVAFVFLDQVDAGFLSQLRMAMRVNPQSSSMRSISLCSGGAQPK